MSSRKQSTASSAALSSHDSGLHLDQLDQIEDEEINDQTNNVNDEYSYNRDKIRHKIERNDSGLGSSQEHQRSIRVWRPGNPDSAFLDQEDERIRHEEWNTNATDSHCYDCDCEIVERFTGGVAETVDPLCKSCGKSRIERKEAVIELIETEVGICFFASFSFCNTTYD